MGTENKTESGKAGKPGEKTANIAAAAEAATDDLNLTPGGITDLLKSEFATGSGGAEAGGEVQPAAETTETLATDENEPAEEPAAAAAEEGATEEPAQPATEEAELPPELEAAIQSWEEQGKGELPPVLQALVDRRINKLISRAKTAEEQVTSTEAKVSELTAELEQARSEIKNPTAVNVPILMDEKTISQHETTYNQFVSDAENFLDDTATAEERGRIERFMESNSLDVPGLKRQVREANKELLKFPAKREALTKYKQAEAAAEPEVKKYFPWMENKSSTEYQMAKGVLEAIPDLRQRTPLHKVVLGVYVLGLQQFEKMRKGAAATNGNAVNGKTAKAPPKVPAAGAAAPAAAKGSGKVAAEEAARAKMAKNPNRESVTELLKIGLRS